MLNTAPHTLFISDLHLTQARPATIRLLLDFLDTTARGAQSLYVLGDLFEYWAGDDDLATPPHPEVCAAFASLADAGTRVYFMHGNRDFLIADKFAEASHATLLPDPWPLELHGRRALLSHGDTLCTDDTNYQAFRRMVRDPAWQRAFLAQPLVERRAQIESLRMRSESEKSSKAAEIMDVSQDAVLALLREYDYPALLIHGHTHRPASHAIRVDGHDCIRWVLGDWDAAGDYLRCDAEGCSRGTVATAG